MDAPTGTTEARTRQQADDDAALTAAGSTIAEGAGTTPDAASVDPGQPKRSGRPASVNAIFAILAITGGGLLGYSISVAAGSGTGRDYSLLWALLGAALIVAAWGLRNRHWWAAAAVLAVALVGLVAGMFGVYGLLVLANSPGDARASWFATVGLTAVGAAAIAILGLLPSAWGWIIGSARARARSMSSGLEAPPAA